MTNDILGYIQNAVAALLAVAVLFGLDLTEDQVAGILAAIAAIGALAFAVNTRVGKPREIRDAARKAGVNV